MTTTPQPTPATSRWPFPRTAPDARQFPAAGVIGEIKPHNPQQVREGIKQLRVHYNRNRGRGFAYQLVTYEQVSADVTRYLVRLADPGQLGRIVRSQTGAGEITTWQPIGEVRWRDAATVIPQWQCPTLRGTRLEPKVRALYQGWMRNVQGHARGPGRVTVPWRPATARGADIRHETAAFLRELANELEVASS